MSLRTKYLAAVRYAQHNEKELVGKSASGPDIACVRNAQGEVIGFGPVESLSKAELSHLQHLEDVRKSVDDASDGLGGGVGPNPANDCLSDFFPTVQSSGRVVQKSADVEDDEKYPELYDLFPSTLGVC